MVISLDPRSGYQQQLAHWSRALAAGQADGVADALAEPGMTANIVHYLDNAVGERIRLLTEELSFVALAFDDFDALVQEYLERVPRTTYRRDDSDPQRFLGWLANNHARTPKQKSFVAYQEAEYRVHARARANRTAYLRFQELWARAGNRLEVDVRAKVHLNPTHAWAWMELPGQPAGDVLLFASRTAVRSHWLKPREAELIRTQADREPCTLEQWRQQAQQTNNEQWLALYRTLAGVGLLALE